MMVTIELRNEKIESFTVFASFVLMLIDIFYALRVFLFVYLLLGDKKSKTEMTACFKLSKQSRDERHHPPQV